MKKETMTSKLVSSDKDNCNREAPTWGKPTVYINLSNIIFSLTLHGVKFNSTIHSETPLNNNEWTNWIYLSNIVPVNDTEWKWSQFIYRGICSIKMNAMMEFHLHNTMFRWDYIQLYSSSQVHNLSNIIFSKHRME